MAITTPARRLICFLLLIGQVIYGQAFGESNVVQIDGLEGETIRLSCKFRLTPNELNDPEGPVFFWMRKDLNNSENISIKQNVIKRGYSLDINLAEGRYDLIIGAATYYRDNAKFECYAKTATGESIKEYYYQLTILIPPGPPVITPSVPTFVEGETGELVCQSSGGSPAPEIQWFRNGTLAVPSLRLSSTGSNQGLF